MCAFKGKNDLNGEDWQVREGAYHNQMEKT